jgi:type I site-specific restriction endonuclease
LTELMGRDLDSALARLGAMPNSHPRLRPYQIEANIAVENAIAQRKREMLQAMATGTGKTFTTVNQIYRLMKSGVAQRVMFLVDRRALAAQAVRAFKSFEPEPGLKFDQIYELYSQRFQQSDFGEDEKFDPTVLPQRYLTDPQPGHAFVYICTIQRMAMNLFGRAAAGMFGGEIEAEDDADKLNIPIHAFDVVIADECHRGYTAGEVSVWRDTLNHFDAIKIGLGPAHGHGSHSSCLWIQAQLSSHVDAPRPHDRRVAAGRSPNIGVSHDSLGGPHAPLLSGLLRHPQSKTLAESLQDHERPRRALAILRLFLRTQGNRPRADAGPT